MVTPQMAELMRNWHPLRLQYEVFSSQNPLMKPSRTPPTRPARTANRSPRTIPSWHSRRRCRSRSSVRSTNGATRRKRSARRCSWRSMARRPCRPPSASIRKSAPSRRREMDPKHRELLQARIAELKSKIGSGGLSEAGIRALLYVGSARGMVDERSLEALRRIRQADEASRMTLAEFKMLVREQFFMLLLDREAALAAIPKLLPDRYGRAPQGIFLRSRMFLPPARRFRERWHPGSTKWPRCSAWGRRIVRISGRSERHPDIAGGGASGAAVRPA